MKDFPGKNLDEFNIDENSYHQYMKKRIGFVDGKASERIISAIKKNLRME